MSSKQKYQAIIMWPSLYLNQLKILKIFFFLFITFSLSKGQTQIDSSIMSKWLHATINIECQPSYAKERDKLWDLMVAEKISWDEYNRKSDSLYLVPRKTGSAIYLSYNQPAPHRRPSRGSSPSSRPSSRRSRSSTSS